MHFVNGANRLPAAILRSPVTWGSIASLAFYAAIHSGTLHGAFVTRYFGSHPVEYVATSAFFVGLAALMMKLIEAVRQLLLVGNPLLEEPPVGGQGLEDCQHLLDELDSLPPMEKNTLLVHRVRAGIEHVVRNRTADELEDELKYLADLDAERAHENYGLVRLIIWAIPILGFLGTVVGITLAIANLSPEALETSLPEVTAGLGVAFDTTAMALGLSIVLMFAQFLANHFEQRLLAVVDHRTGDELLGRFAKSAPQEHPELASVRGMADAVIHATERLVERQAELWKTTIDAAHEQWSHLSGSTGKQLENSLSAALDHGLQAASETLSVGAERLTASQAEHWERMQKQLTAAAEASATQQQELARHGAMLADVIQATGQVVSLEDALNRNLSALSGSHNFEETLLSLSAAIHLLNGRLGQTGLEKPHIEIDRSPREGKAA
ncbi:MotA_ExbB domain-containing protein [Durusdinium trenchii]|uniref:MotA_ExbB domain-containing protein n=1 Tax=Durusdinium trenchii TaxID=1381693 RepID=A0ABP0SQN6_9DINO